MKKRYFAIDSNVIMKHCVPYPPMDPIDRQLIALLQANARHTYEELGDAIGLSAPAAFQRVRKLEARGIIAGYHARVEPAAVGRPVVAFLWVSPAAGDQSQALLARWEVSEDVQECHTVTGSEAYLLKLRVRDAADLARHAAALRQAGCSVRTEVAVTTAFERWSLSVHWSD
jgi:Lrp/AsnC family leucine-responsive transcriptional regulator